MPGSRAVLHCAVTDVDVVAESQLGVHSARTVGAMRVGNGDQGPPCA